MAKPALASTLLGQQKIIPVVAVDNERQALGLAQALIEGGISVIEITLRNSFGLQAIERVKRSFPQMLTLAGTVNNSDDMLAAVDAGADGIISPGITASLLKAAEDTGVTYLPGVASASEVLMGMQYGLTEFKLFPATVVGGVGALKALSGPFPDIRFCPTGGVNEKNYRDFLSLKNVICVGGSWLAPSDMIAREQWEAITQRCQQSYV
jgi:2-dehydro-3-deoxyphosphogluconate aldolase/(4S)-4-hydroxy-2-oxoglutarate aldolase